MGMLADMYKDDERGRAMGIAFTGLALGLIGVYKDETSPESFIYLYVSMARFLHPTHDRKGCKQYHPQLAF